MLSFSINFNKKAIRTATITLIPIYAIAFGMLIFILKPNVFSTDVLLRGLYTLTVISTACISVWSTLKTVNYKRLWQLIATGMVFWAVGEIVFFSYLLRYGGVLKVPSSSLADVFSIGYIPIILGIMFSLGRIRRPFDSSKKQFLVSISMLSLAMLTVCYHFVLVPGWYASQGMHAVQRMYAVGYPIFDWIIFVSLLLASRRFQERKIEGWLILLTAAFSLTLVAVLIFNLAGNHRNPFTTWAMLGTAILISMSAIDEITGIFIGTLQKGKARKENQLNLTNPSMNVAWSSLLPLAASAVIPLVWIAYSLNGRPGELPILGCLSTLILILLIYRNYLLVSDNALLMAKALHDNLTGLNNHRFFQETLGISLLKAEKTRRDVSLIVIDVDDFSEINKTFGHVFGDRVLATIGRTVAAKVRESDEACRLNGDDFAIVLPRTSSDRALVLAEGMRKSIKKSLRSVFPELSVTVTAGISTFPTIAKNKDDLIAMADGALYWAKIHGKDQSLVYDPQVVEALSAEERAKRAEEAALVETVKSLAMAVDARDPYTRQHSKRVSCVAAEFAEYIGLDKGTVQLIEFAGILHDIGKIGIPDVILNKPSRLTDEEMDVIKEHPKLSAQILASTTFTDILPAVRHHHERWDGGGYPAGLKGTEIPLEARIMALADTFDAMTTDRPYRKGLSRAEALIEIERCAGTQFDPDLAVQFVQMFEAPANVRELRAAETVDEEILDIETA